MSIKLKELNEKRGAKSQQARAIITKSEAEKRDLLDTERNEIRAIQAEVENLDADISIHVRQLAAESGKGVSLSKQESRDIGRFDYQKLLTTLHRSARGSSGVSFEGIEAEMISEGDREARASGIQVSGLCLPRMLVRGSRPDFEQRDITATGTTSTSLDQGGMTIATEKRGLLDDFYNASVIRGLGSVALEGLVGKIDLPRVVAGTDPTKKAENGSADEVSPTTAMLSLSPKRLPAFIDISDQLLLQSSVAIQTIMSASLVSQMSSIREKAFWHGGGTNEPTGIASTSGIGSVAGGTNGLAPTYAHMLALEEQVDAQNALLGRLAYASNGQIRKKLKQTVQNPSDTTANWIIGKDGQINGYNAAFTNAISRTLTKGTSSGVASAIFFGNFADFYEAYWGGLQIEMLRDSSNAITGLYRLVATTFYDGGVVRPKSFAAMLDALGA